MELVNFYCIPNNPKILATYKTFIDFSLGLRVMWGLWVSCESTWSHSRTPTEGEIPIQGRPFSQQRAEAPKRQSQIRALP